MKRQPVYRKINRIISTAAGYIEIVMAVIIIIAILLLTLSLFRYFPQGDLLDFRNENFNEFLSSVLTLVVGLEFVKMLCMHTPETVIEVLMFATARQMIVEHLSPANTLIGVVTIAILFATRKFLFIQKTGKRTDSEDTQEKTGIN